MVADGSAEILQIRVLIEALRVVEISDGKDRGSRDEVGTTAA